MKFSLVNLLLLLTACTSNEPRIDVGDDVHDNWKNTFPNGSDTSFYHHESEFPNGQVLHMVDYVNGKRHGLFQEWDSSGTIVREGCYLLGLKHGVWRTYKHGLLTQRSYTNDTLGGPTTEALDDGRIVHGQYEKGKESGLWIWVRGQSLDQTAIYVEGKYEGWSYGYWPNGVRQLAAHYTGDSMITAVQYWDSLGRPSDSKSVGWTLTPHR